MHLRHGIDLLLHVHVVDVAHLASIRDIVSDATFAARTLLLVDRILQLRHMLQVLADHDVLVGVLERMLVARLATEYRTATCADYLRIHVVRCNGVVVCGADVL